MFIRTSDSGRHASARGVLSQLVCMFALWTAAGALYAAPVFKCVDAQGHVAYRDIQCPARAQQTRIELQAQPTIGDADEAAAARARASVSHHTRTATHSRRHPVRRKRAKPAMSWECHAGDGEVFYRHKRCPGSVPGDGTVRVDYASTKPRNQPRRHRNAWSRVRVHGTKVSRAEACRRIRGVGASSRDGHLRDATVSTYDHLMGRDLCSGG